MHTTSTQDRIDSLDLIRGVAILGIYIMNIYSMTAPDIAYSVPRWQEGSGIVDDWVYAFQSLFVESRFMSLFSLLFGVGLAVQWDRMAQRGTEPKHWIKRRLGWLLVIGLLHGFFIWFGDVLALYALCGFFVIRHLGDSVRRLVTTGIMFLVIGQLFLGYTLFGALITGENIMQVPDLPFSQEALAELRNANSDLGVRTVRNLTENAFMLMVMPFITFWFSTGLMLIGVALYRVGFFNNPHAWRWALPLWALGFSWGAIVLGFRYAWGLETSAAQATISLMMIAGPPMAIGYASLLVPIARSGSRLVTMLRNTGKMAFTLYISQSTLTVLFFSQIAPGLWGTLNRLETLFIVAGFTLIQVIVAHLWITRIGQGPLERLWRWLAFRKLER
ncbi:DUF418 domain-containing protein [Saccharospirillum impatiens]|uniref:DUF418 domain-containing protein n=1 Tax=Saccharospirillum impatiens TaxID=169438 RepID=UPI00041A77DD|nr:DUF418 domain-containing protein [Saccharospirillum impatiens]